MLLKHTGSLSQIYILILSLILTLSRSPDGCLLFPVNGYDINLETDDKKRR